MIFIDFRLDWIVYTDYRLDWIIDWIGLDWIGNPDIN